MEKLTKQCIKCKLDKPIEEFYLQWNHKTYRGECKECCKIYKKIWRKNNLESCSKSSKKHYKNKTTKTLEQRNRDRINKLAEGRKKYKQRIYEYYAKRYVNDIEFNIEMKIRKRILMAIKKQFTHKAHKTIELLDCSFEEFKEYFQNKFTENMTWDKFMNGEIHIDHIVPCCRFDLADSEQQKMCFHYTNLQPLWAKDNLSKSNKILLDIV